MIDDLVMNYSDRAQFNYSVHISPEYKFVYFSNPKCGCTTIKATLNISVAKLLGVDLKYTSIGQIHDRSYNILKRPSDIGYDKFMELLTDSSVIKFSFIRNTYERLASAYASKFIWDTDVRRGFNKYLGRDAQAELSFDEFIDLVSSNEHKRDFDEHWRLQAKQICYNEVDYRFIGRFEEMDGDLRKLLDVLFPGHAFLAFDARNELHGNTSTSASYLKFLKPPQIANIRRAYARDEEMMAEARLKNRLGSV